MGDVRGGEDEEYHRRGQDWYTSVSTVQYITLQYSMVKYSTVQYSTVKANCTGLTYKCTGSLLISGCIRQL